MEKIWMILLYMLLPCGLVAQQPTSYNRKGDEAMKRLDYSDAKMWYEEGISQCDPYSIKQLTAIWLANERMHPSMRSLMNKCLNCLNVKATENDTTAMSQLVVYYTEGIGTPKSEELASYWSERLETFRRLVDPIVPYEAPQEKKERMRYFAGYSFSQTAPYGLTVGGVGKRFGWYARFKTNMSFQNYEKNKTIGDFTANASYQYLEKKANTYAATAGLVVKCTTWLYASVGAGYGNHDLIYHFRTFDFDDYTKQKDVWCKQNADSFKGVAAELDFMVKIGPAFVSAGCHTINFKYMDLNAGLGIFF